jgi:polysaccharide deacetylase family protein (PEP-CTERM system associated)
VTGAPLPASRSAGAERSHILTVVVEDYYQTVAFRNLIHPSQWYRFERRVADNTRRALDLLAEFEIEGTFFVLGCVADEMPGIVRDIAERGHEIATKGYYHRSIEQMTPAAFREDLRRSREAIERACGLRVRGHRVARGRFGLHDLWALDILAEEGFAYDSSFYPRLRSIASQPWRRFPHLHRYDGRELWELPLSTWKVGGLLVPLAGGNYFRQLPLTLVERAFRDWERQSDAPFVMYFHVWELDPELPEITAAGPLTRLRQYRNLQRMPALVRHFLSQSSFSSVARHLGLEREPIEAGSRPAEPMASRPSTRVAASRPAVTVVVPCFNEERVLPYLANTLQQVAEELERLYDLRFVFVDDASTDGTWKLLHETFGSSPHVRFFRHERNRGVAAAILTGIREADTEVVCSIDCDCTYDPHQLRELIPMLTQDVAMVTASPYHPSGRVLNVPGWRLFLSRTLSRLYGLVLHQKLHTYTSCFRAYRRSAVQDLEIREGGFLGVAEMVCALDSRGERVVECPAVLEVRMLGRSKMKLLSGIAGHLRLLARMGRARLAGRTPKNRETRKDP